MDHIVPGVSREAVVSKQGAAAMAAMVVRIAIVGDVVTTLLSLSFNSSI